MEKAVKNLAVLWFLLALAPGCRDESTFPLPIHEFNRGGAGGVYLRQVEIISGIFNDEARATAHFAVRVEAVDGRGGATIEHIELLASFRDLTPQNGILTRPETLIKTLPFEGNFTTDATSGLPRGTLSVTFNEVRTAMGLTDAQVERTDQFIIRQAVRLKDGRIFSSNNTSQAMLTGAFYQSPFRNIVSVSCPSQLQGVSGTYRTTTVAPACGAVQTGTFSFDGKDGQIPLPDASFGMYNCAYGLAASTGVTLNDVCRLLFFTGADQFDTIFEIESVVVSGTRFTLEITTNFGELFFVEFTRADGQNWPADLRI